MIAIPVKVVDASALCAVLFSEPEGADVAARLRDSRLVAPALLTFEIANTCLKKIRRHPAMRESLLAALALVPRMDIDVVAVEHVEVIDLAERLQLSAYDASYLWLSGQLGAELVTLDVKLEAARMKEG